MSVIGFYINLNYRVMQHLKDLALARGYRGAYAHAKLAVSLLTFSIEKEYNEWQQKKQNQNQEGTK